VRRNLIIQSSKQGLDIALLENDKLVEFHQDLANKEYVVGDVYLGRVKKILPSLNAAFVDIGFEKQAFLHYHDLGFNFLNVNRFTQTIINKHSPNIKIDNFTDQREINKNGDISSVLKTDQLVIVQIIKEPISTKGHRITTQITLAGRYIVLIPFSNSINVSKRIHERKERKRLLELSEDHKPQNCGMIIRTAAEGIPSRLLEQDIKNIHQRWQEIVNNLAEQKTKLLSEYGKATSLLRDMLNETFDSVVVDDKATYEQLQSYLESISIGKKKILRLHRDSVPPFEVYNVDKQIKSLFGKIVNFGKGAYLILEHTEAMHVIDVNSGSKTVKDTSREGNVLNINIEAAEEIARQLRLRDIGGLIVVDFIDMRSSQNQKILLEKMKELMSNDRAQHSFTSISKFGLMEITRERVKPEIKLSISEVCPACKGSGEMKPYILVISDIESSIQDIIAEQKINYFILKVHPFVYSYLTKGIISRRIKWMWKYKIWIDIRSTESSYINSYKILDKKENDLEEI
jgi:ribonuclease G